MTTSTQETYLPEPAWANILGCLNADKPQLPIFATQSAYAIQQHKNDNSWLIKKMNHFIINNTDLMFADEPANERDWRSAWAQGIQDLYDYGHLDPDEVNELFKFNLKNYHRIQEEYALIFNKPDEEDFIFRLWLCDLAHEDEDL